MLIDLERALEIDLESAIKSSPTERHTALGSKTLWVGDNRPLGLGFRWPGIKK